MLRKLLELLDWRTRRILRRACDGDLRARGKAPGITVWQARIIGEEVRRHCGDEK